MTLVGMSVAHNPLARAAWPFEEINIGSDYWQGPQPIPSIGASLTKAHLLKVPLNKLGHYYDSDDTNAMMPISYLDNKAMTILDGGAQ